IDRDNKQKYGTIGAGLTIAKDFSVKVPKKAACGSEIKIDLDVSSSLGDSTQEITLLVGQPNITSAENFYNGVPPNLPSGWTTSATFSLVPWVTTTSGVDSPPNSVFGAEPDGGGDSELVSASIPIVNPDAVLTFRHFVAIKQLSEAFLQISI